MAKLRKQRQHAARKAQAELIGAAWLPTLSARAEAILFALVALIVSALLHFSSDKFADPDGFYHFRHAALYGEGNLFSSAFPWMPFSVIGKYSADIWYGFHILLIPFTWIGDPVLAMRLAGLVLTWAFLLTIYCACAKLDLKPAWLWPFALLVSSAFLLHRVTMLRPQVLSLGLAVLLLAEIVLGNLRGVFVIAFAIAWVHLSLFFRAADLARFISGDKNLSRIRNCAGKSSLRAARGSSPAGCCGPIRWARRRSLMFKLSILRLRTSLMRRWNSAPNCGRWCWLTTATICRLSCCGRSVYCSYCGAPLPAKCRNSPCTKNSSRSAERDCLAGVFSRRDLFARRGFDFCSALACCCWRWSMVEFLPRKKWPQSAPFWALYSCLAVYSATQRHRVVALGWDVNQAEPAARWLGANSNPGDVVFNFRWSYFPELFFWNTKNVYTSGMDPIFQYAFDPQLYLSGLKIAARPALRPLSHRRLSRSRRARMRLSCSKSAIARAMFICSRSSMLTPIFIS